MSKSIFISCVYEDSHRIESIKKWAIEGKLGSVVITYETEDKRQNGKEEIKSHIREKIRGAAVILILIGDNTHNHHWIQVEAELANSFHKKIVCVRIPNTTGSVPPILNRYELANFDPESIKRLL